METKTIDQTVEINAPAEKVWEALWDKESYKKWASAYMEGSHYTGKIADGEVIEFLSNDKTGMRSKVSKFEENKEVVFNHINEITKGEVSGSLENMEERYLLTENDGKTTLSLRSDMPQEYFDEMNDSTKKALKILKEIAEQ